MFDIFDKEIYNWLDPSIHRHLRMVNPMCLDVDHSVVLNVKMMGELYNWKEMKNF